MRSFSSAVGACRAGRAGRVAACGGRVVADAAGIRRCPLAEQSVKHTTADLEYTFLRRIAQAFVGTALGSHHQRPFAVGRGRLHRHADGQPAVIGFHLLAERLVELDLAGREHRRTQLDGCRLRRKGKAIAVEVIAIRHVEANLDRLRIDLMGSKPEGLFRRQEVVIGGMRHAGEAQPQRGQQHDQQPRCGTMPHGLPSPPTTRGVRAHTETHTLPLKCHSLYPHHARIIVLSPAAVPIASITASV